MTNVTRVGKTVHIEFDTEEKAKACEEQTRYMFEHPNIVKMAARFARR